MKKSTVYWIIGGLAVAVGGYFVYNRFFSGSNGPVWEPVGGKRVELSGKEALRESGVATSVIKKDVQQAGERFKKGIDKLANLG